MQYFLSSSSFKNIILASATLFAMSGPAYAQNTADEPELYFHPSAAWEVSKKDVMCSIGTTFNNGYIMRFSGDELWVDSMDINFKQDIFNPDQSYKVGLSVPGVENKTFQAQPASSRTLSVGLRKQKGFYQSLRDSAVLDLNVDGNEFRFYMTGFSTAAEKFERCMAGAIIKDERVAANALAERSEERNFMVNESIAMEEQAKANQSALSVSSKDIDAGDESLNDVTQTQNMVDLTDGADAPVVQGLDVKDTHKVGNVTVPANDGAASQEMPEAAEPTPVLDTKSALAEDVEPVSSTPSSEAILKVDADDPALDEMTEKTAASSGEAKLSEQLAQKIDENPEWLKSDRDKALSDLARRQLEVPEGVKAMPIVPSKQAIEQADMDASESMEQAPVEMADDASDEMAANSAEDEQADEIITFDPAPEAADVETAPAVPPSDVEVSETLVPMEEEEPKDIAEVEAAPAPVVAPAPVRETVRRSSPEPVVSTERFSGNADFSSDATQKDLDEMRKQIVRMENTITQLKEENVALNKELKSSLRASEEERLEIASDNWNLEQATKQYNEAERQIKRLGLELQKERARHAAEKNELEALLFDPQVTSEAQLARLAQLEAELAQVKLELEKERSRFQQQMQKSWDGASQ